MLNQSCSFNLMCDSKIEIRMFKNAFINTSQEIKIPFSRFNVRFSLKSEDDLKVLCLLCPINKTNYKIQTKTNLRKQRQQVTPYFLGYDLVI